MFIAPSHPHPDSIRVLLIHGDAMVRAQLRLLVESHGGLCMAGEAGTGTEALDLAEALSLGEAEPADIILLDLDLPGESGLKLISELLERLPQAHLLVLTEVRDPHVGHRAISAGAMGVVMKEEASSLLLQAIERVHQGEVWLDDSIMTAVLAEMRCGEIEFNPNDNLN